MYGKPKPPIPSLQAESPYQRVLFKQGRRLQARELQLIQSIPLQWIGKVLSSLWGYAVPLSGLEVTIASGWLRVSPGTFGAFIPSLGWRALDCPGYITKIPEVPLYWVSLLPEEPQYRSIGEDPSLGGPPLATLGGYGCYIALSLSTQNEGYPIAYVEEGVIHSVPRVESFLRDYWEKEVRLRTWYELGDCILSGLYIQELNQSALISPGRALIRGSLVNIDSVRLTPILSDLLCLSESGHIYSPSLSSFSPPPPRRVFSNGVPISVGGAALYIYNEDREIPQREARSSPDYFLLLARRVNGRWETPYRLPSLRVLYSQLQSTTNRFLSQDGGLQPDIYVPSFNIYRGSNYWTLPHVTTTIDLPGRTLPYDRALHAWQDRITETNLLPQSLQPWITRIGRTIIGYNLHPGSYPPSNPDTYITKVGSGYSPSVGGVLSLEGLQPIGTDALLGSYGISTSAPIDRGIGQSFESPTSPISICRVSFWAGNSFGGVVSITDSIGGLPSGRALLSIPFSSQPGWVDIDLPYPLYIAKAFCVVITTADPDGRVGVYNPSLPPLSTLDPNPTEGGGSSHLVLSTHGENKWTDIRHRDMCWRIYKAIPKDTLPTIINLPVVESSGEYDGMEINLPTYAPPGTSLQYIWKDGEDILSDLTSLGGNATVALSLSMVASRSILPSFLGGSIDLWTTSLEGTWVSITREEPSIYTSIILHLYVSLPPGTSVTPYASSNGGQSWFDLSPSLAPYAGISEVSQSTALFFTADNLPPASTHYTITGEGYEAYRTTIKIKVEMKTLYAHIRPLLYSVEVITV
jgi:hypothetical protein